MSRARVQSGVGLTVFLLGAVFLLGQQSPAAGAGRVLTPGEMARIFGDAPAPVETGTDPCKKRFNCNTSFYEGASDCAYCDVDSARDTCCAMGKGTKCGYDNSRNACGDSAKRWVGPGQGQGTCGGCTSSKYKDDGDCTVKEVDNDSGDCK